MSTQMRFFQKFRSAVYMAFIALFLANCASGTSDSRKKSRQSQPELQIANRPALNKQLPTNEIIRRQYATTRPNLKPALSTAQTNSPIASLQNKSGFEPRLAAALPKTNNPIVRRTQQETWYVPKANARWQWQLMGTVNTNYPVDVYNIDLYDSSQSLINRLHASGKKVICYFSAGTYENWRSDASLFPKKTLGKPLDDFPGEKWIDIRDPSIKQILSRRLDLAASKKCDAVEPDNVDGYINKSGFHLTAKDQLKFNLWIAKEAHARNLGVGLKNDLDQVTVLEEFFDFAVNEQCYEYNECHALEPFTRAGKAVFQAEYMEVYSRDKKVRESLCRRSRALNLSTLVLPLYLDDSFRFDCHDKFN